MPVTAPNVVDRIITNDLYLAAYLVCEGCSLVKLAHNGRRRISFVVSGENVRRLRDSYRGGQVQLNLPLFREQLIILRRKMDFKQRSAAYGPDTRERAGAAQA